MLKTIVVDDQPVILDALVHQIKSWDFVKLVCSTSNPATSKAYFESTKPHVAILDIDMPELDGLSLAEWINQHSPKTKIIFCTSHAAYMKEAFRVYAYDFIEKPIDYSRLKESLLRLNHEVQEVDQHIEVFTENGTLFLSIAEIVAVEAQGKHAVLYTLKEAYAVKNSFKSLEQTLSEGVFYKSSRSYLVNLYHVKGLENLNRTSFLITLSNPKAYAQLSKKSYEAFKEKLTQTKKQ